MSRKEKYENNVLAHYIIRGNRNLSIIDNGFLYKRYTYSRDCMADWWNMFDLLQLIYRVEGTNAKEVYESDRVVKI